MNSIIMPLSMLNMITAYFYLPPFFSNFLDFSCQVCFLYLQMYCISSNISV